MRVTNDSTLRPTWNSKTEFFSIETSALFDFLWERVERELEREKDICSWLTKSHLRVGKEFYGLFIDFLIANRFNPIIANHQWGSGNDNPSLTLRRDPNTRNRTKLIHSKVTYHKSCRCYLWSWREYQRSTASARSPRTFWHPRRWFSTIKSR